VSTRPESSRGGKIAYAVAVTLLTAAIMTAWGIFIRPYTDGLSGWLGDRLGAGWALAAILAVAGLAGAYGLWPRADDPPPVVIRKPRWLRVMTWIFLGIPVVGVVVGMGVFIAVQLYRN
jgi:membrane protease YdiL (CAAX protease family)